MEAGLKFKINAARDNEVIKRLYCTKREKLLFVRLYGVMNKFPKKSERDDSVVGRSKAPEMGMILWTILNRQMTPKILQINNLFQNIFRFFQFWAQNVYEKK